MCSSHTGARSLPVGQGVADLALLCHRVALAMRRPNLHRFIEQRRLADHRPTRPLVLELIEESFYFNCTLSAPNTCKLIFSSMQKARNLIRLRGFRLVAGEGFEPSTFGL